MRTPIYIVYYIITCTYIYCAARSLSTYIHIQLHLHIHLILCTSEFITIIARSLLEMSPLSYELGRLADR